MNTFAHAAALALRSVVAGPSPASAGRLAGAGARLEAALQAAVHRAWTAVEVSLAGGPLWRRHARPDDEPLREYLRPHLDAARGGDRREAVRQLRAARSAGALLGSGEGVGPAVRLAQGFAPPADARRHEQTLLAELQAALRPDYPELARIAAAAPAGRAALLAAAARHFFARELAGDAELGFRLPAGRPDALSSGEEAALDALVRNADRIVPAAAEALARPSGPVAPPSRRLAPEPPPEPAFAPLPVGPGSDAGEVQAALRTLARRYAPPAPCDAAGAAEVRRVLDCFRALPAAERNQPERLDLAAGLALAAGDYGTARHCYRAAAELHADPSALAAAHHGLFRAALGQEDYGAALAPFLESVRLDPRQFGTFPLGEYEPELILATGPGGIDYLCRHHETPGDWIVRTLPPDPAGKAGQHAAEALRRVGHPAVPRVLDCGRLGEKGARKTYVVFDAFAGTPLDVYVRSHGPFTLADALDVLAQLADGLEAAHGSGVTHGAVDPSAVLVRRGADGWAVRLAEFAPSLRGTGAPAHADYRAPEATAGRPGDVYGWAKVACFALFGVPLPSPADWRAAPADLANLLRACLCHDPRGRPQGFADVLEVLGRRQEIAGRPIDMHEAESTATHAVGALVRKSRRDRALDMERQPAGGQLFGALEAYLLAAAALSIVAILIGIKMTAGPAVAELADAPPPAPSYESSPAPVWSALAPPAAVPTRPFVAPAVPIQGPPAEWPSLFSAAALTGWERSAPGGGPTGWRVVPGEYVEVRPGAGGIRTAEEFGGPVAVTLEFWLPPAVGGGRAESGLFVYGRYEVEIHDSFGGVILSPMSCGAISGVVAPLRNACRPAGEWQTLEVTYRPPPAGRDGDPGRIGVVLNSIEVLRDAPAGDPPGSRAAGAPAPRSGTIGLQDAGSAVRFRNIRVRPGGG